MFHCLTRRLPQAYVCGCGVWVVVVKSVFVAAVVVERVCVVVMECMWEGIFPFFFFFFLVGVLHG